MKTLSDASLKFLWSPHRISGAQQVLNHLPYRGLLPRLLNSIESPACSKVDPFKKYGPHWALQEVPSPHGFALCDIPAVGCHVDRCALPNAAQSIELTTGWLQSMSRNVSNMIRKYNTGLPFFFIEFCFLLHHGDILSGDWGGNSNINDYSIRLQ